MTNPFPKLDSLPAVELTASKIRTVRRNCGAEWSHDYVDFRVPEIWVSCIWLVPEDEGLFIILVHVSTQLSQLCCNID
jgi:hypothetical protein